MKPLVTASLSPLVSDTQFSAELFSNSSAHVSFFLFKSRTHISSLNFSIASLNAKDKEGKRTPAVAQMDRSSSLMKGDMNLS